MTSLPDYESCRIDMFVEELGYHISEMSDEQVLEEYRKWKIAYDYAHNPELQSAIKCLLSFDYHWDPL